MWGSRSPQGGGGPSKISTAPMCMWEPSFSWSRKETSTGLSRSMCLCAMCGGEPKWLRARRTTPTEHLGRSVAVLRARIGEGLPRFGDEAPVVGVWVKRELQNPVGVGVAHLAVGLWRAEAV